MMALTLMMALIVGDGQAKSPAHLMAGMPDRGCSGGLAEQAATKAREAFPSQEPTLEVLSARRGYLRKNLQLLFDPEKKGFLDLKRYSDFEWASVLVRMPNISCSLTFEDFLIVTFGSKESIAQIDRGQPFLKRAEFDNFRYMDRKRKGFLERTDYDYLSAQSFRTFDKNHDGKVSFEEFFN